MNNSLIMIKQVNLAIKYKDKLCICHGSTQGKKNVGQYGIEMKIKIERCFNCNHHVITLVTKRWEEYECWKCGCGCMTIHRNVRNSEIKENEDGNVD